MCIKNVSTLMLIFRQLVRIIVKLRYLCVAIHCIYGVSIIHIKRAGFSLKRGAAAVRRATAKVRTLNLKRRSERCAAL